MALVRRFLVLLSVTLCLLPPPNASTWGAEQATSPASEEQADAEAATPAAEGATAGAMTLGLEGSGESLGLGVTLTTLENFIFTGAATHKIPIEVPPGRAGIGDVREILTFGLRGSR